MSLQPKKLIILGDSSVHGWGDKDGGGWCERLKRKFMSFPNGPVIYSLGVRGDGLEKVALRWKREWEVRGELRRKSPDGIILSVGLNDTAKIGQINGRPQLEAEAYRFGLYQLLKEIIKFTKVFMIGINPVIESSMPFADCLWYSNKSISIYESQIEEVCLELDIPFLPIHKCLSKEIFLDDLIDPDGIHLNNNGHYWMYQKILNWTPILKWAEVEKKSTLTILK